MSDSENDSTIVMTGVTAGFGLRALGIVAQNTSNPIIVGARDASKLPSQIRDKVTVLPLDLSQLDTVVDFCSQVSEHGPVGSLILNVGTSSRKMAQTTDGLDLTFQANYLSHFGIIQRLWDSLSETAQVVVTSSGTHDPEEKTPPPPPRHADVNMLARPATDPDKDRMVSKAAARAYTSSKLCCTMLSLEIATRRPNGTSISFDPGLVPGTQLTREFPQWLVRLLIPIMSRTMPADRTSTMSASANALAYLMVKSSLIGANGDYLAMRGGYSVVVPPSEMARDVALRKKMWSDSEALLAANENWL